MSGVAHGSWIGSRRRDPIEAAEEVRSVAGVLNLARSCEPRDLIAELLRTLLRLASLIRAGRDHCVARLLAFDADERS